MTALRRAGLRIEAFALLLAAGVAFRLLRTERFLRWWTPRVGRPRPQGASLEELARAADHVLAATRRRNCLTRSLVLYRMLRRRGVDARLRMGVRRAGTEGIAGHAWLVLDDVPCCPYGQDPAEYAVTVAYPEG